MNCAQLEASLDAYRQGRLSDLEQRAAAEHLASCARCRDVAETLGLVLGELPHLLDETAGADVGPDLVAAILSRTTGPACGRAQGLLAELADGALAADDARLVELHLVGCPRCAALHRTMVWALRELSALAVLDPGPALTAAIVGATSQLHPRRPSAWEALREWYGRFVARPRFAWEAAYVGTLVLVLLFGTSISPLRQVPGRALAIIQVDPRDATSSAADQLRAAHTGIGAVGGRAWSASGGRIADGARAAGARFASRYPGMDGAWDGLGVHAGELRAALASRNFAGTTLVLQAMGGDLRALWRAYRGPASSPATAGASAGEAGRTGTTDGAGPHPPRP